MLTFTKEFLRSMKQKHRWRTACLAPIAYRVYEKLRKQKQSASVNSDWWAVGFSFSCFLICISKFVQGTYKFSPMQQFRFDDECVRVWNYADRMIVRLFLHILKPTFKHIISKYCFHLAGPSGVKNALHYVQNVMETSQFNYAIRIDIKSYYGSINHKVLIDQVKQHFNDPRTVQYLETIITSAVDDGGNVFLPQQGIPRRPSLSPFFGALYLSPLDEAFEKREGVVYARHMDDVIILCKTKRQYQRARKILFTILKKLKLKLSSSKTWMGALTKGLHFLGVRFDVAKHKVKNQNRVEIHPRSCARALDKVKSLRGDAVHPANIQRYLVRWAFWWAHTVKPLSLLGLLHAWVDHAREREPVLAWFGTGLLTVFEARAKVTINNRVL